ncbi:MAG: ECF transporter S component [Lachnospiraceae bacterium]|nr:ECF transporter S component [Lachnospiraceae bacterium]
MDKRFDIHTVTAIVIGTIIIIITNYYMHLSSSFSKEWIVQICSAVVIVIAAVTGTVSGFLMPLVSSMIVGIALMGFDVTVEFLILALFGISTGHYMEKLGVRKGEFNGIRIIDFCMLQIMLSIIAWICVYPLSDFYTYGRDLRETLNLGVFHCGISIIIELCICLPVLILCNRLFRQKRLVEDAQREYLYDRK